MAPRLREHWPTQPAHSSRTRPTRSPRSLPPPKQPPLRTPFELFAAQQQLPSSGDSTQYPLSLSPDVQNEWDNLPPEDRQVWEAQYGRQVLERQQGLSSYYNSNCTNKVAPDEPGDDGSGMWSTDSDSEREHPPHRVSKVARKPTAIRVKKSPVIEESGSEAGPAPVRKPTSRVMYRTELYRVKKDMDGNLISDYTKATRHEQPPKLKVTSAPTAEPAPDPVDENLPIFEVTTFLAAPPVFDFKTWQLEAMAQGSAPWPEYDPYGVPPAIRTPRVGGYHPPASELARRRPRFDVESLTPDENDEIRDDESVVDPDKPIEIEGEAGTILEIHSPLIIDAIQKVGPGYPGLAVEGSSLTVTEPFCALMHYRDQMKGYYKASQVGSEPQSSKSTSHLDSKGALVKPESRASDNQPPETRQDGVTHVDELYQFLDHLYLKSVASERVRWTQEVPTCTFEWVWLLFPPQTLIYEPKSFDEPVSRAFRVKTFKLQGLFDESQRSHSPSVNPHRLKSRQDPHFKNHLEKVIIIASYLKHDGRKWTTQKKEFRIVPFKGEKNITDLPAYPARYLKDPDSTTRSRLIERGKRYHSLASRGQFEYHGETLSGSRRRLDGRIMVDSETYHYDRALTRNTRNPDISPYRRSREIEVVREPNSDSDARSYVSISETGSESDDGPFNVVKEIQSRPRRRAVRRSGRAGPQIQAQLDAAKKGKEEADELFMICHSELRAYVLKERDWVRLSVDSISPCSFDQQMIDDLQISPGAKRMIQAFSQGYSMSLGSALERRPTLTAEAWSADFVPGKGRGQIMLLHGRPGTGKTSTAECIAELTKRPLLTVTCGDLGTNSYHVEQELTRWLRLGALWNAVLLFDEADVFLESREHGDIERNGLVSVFLRALEYYQGLMFLTTNRIGTFDEAILSRVHVILHFPDLTDTERAKIWDTSFRKLADERPNIKIDFSLFDLAYRDEKIKNLKWNGREIRNAFNTMIALAEFDAHANGKISKDGKVEVRREHLQEVADMSGGFKRYMRSLRGLDSAGYAKGLGLRDDEFDSKGDGDSKRE